MMVDDFVLYNITNAMIYGRDQLPGTYLWLWSSIWQRNSLCLIVQKLKATADHQPY